MNTTHFTTKREGYGHQGLYFKFNGGEYYICSVYPNVEEQFNDFELSEDCFYNDETEVYTNSNGREVTPIDSWDEFLLDYYKLSIGEVLYDELAHEEFDFDFKNSSYQSIAEWAISQ